MSDLPPGTESGVWWRVEGFERLPQWKRGEHNQVARVTEAHLPALWLN